MDLEYMGTPGTSERMESNQIRRDQKLLEIRRDLPVHREMNHISMGHTHMNKYRVHPKSHHKVDMVHIPHIPSIWVIPLFPDPHTAKAVTIL